MTSQDQRQTIQAQFTCAHIRLTRAPARAGAESDGFQWAPGCVHPKMHALFTAEAGFCDRCPCYTARSAVRR